MGTTISKALIVMALLGTAGAQVSESSFTAPVATKQLSRKQVVRLINVANTPEQHLELARYFRQEAQRKRDREQYYLEVVSTYRMHPPRVDSYRNTPTQGRYEQMADEARDEAMADDRRAFLQEKFAEGLAMPQGPRGVTTH
ncbi:MAG: hypothetical protein WBS19_20440 [Candidatus Korobacteraceae bacterium]